MGKAIVEKTNTKAYIGVKNTNALGQDEGIMAGKAARLAKELKDKWDSKKSLSDIVKAVNKGKATTEPKLKLFVSEAVNQSKTIKEMFRQCNPCEE